MTPEFGYYTALICVSTGMMVFCALLCAGSRALPIPQRRMMLVTFCIVMVAAFLEWGGEAMEEFGSSNRVAYIALKLMEFSLAPLLGAFVGLIFRRTKLGYAILGFCGVHAILEFILSFFGAVIVVDSNNQYHHGAFYWIYVVSYVVCFLYALSEIIRFIVEFRYRSGVWLIATVITCVVGLVVRAIWLEIRLDWLAMAVGMVFLYVSAVESFAQTDYLTMLGNRRSFEAKLTQLKKKEVVILILDLNQFKTVNDTCGHREGDAVLKKVGNMVHAAFDRLGSGFRYGGDEFACILYHDLEELPMALAMFDAAVENERKTDPMMPTISYGYATYKPGEKTVLETIEEADSSMYRTKHRYYLDHDIPEKR